jgi:DnaJ-class molecular chaperone
VGGAVPGMTKSGDSPEGLTMRDPYSFWVSKTASAADIKSAFRKQAKKLHPDANKHDPKAASRFAELTAYEILGEEDKRKAFDRGEIDAEGKPRFQGFGIRRRRAAASAGKEISRRSPGAPTACTARAPCRRRLRRLRRHPQGGIWRRRAGRSRRPRSVR